jgi:ADP-dependent NAD(P)H-hydrate dehydratase / NAD(P)H-hydrate epimerase
MRLIEERSFAAGQTVESLMDGVGLQLAGRIQTFLQKAQRPPRVLLVAGKGNNGADGYTALSHLLSQHVECLAWQVSSPAPHSLIDRRKQAFIAKGGRVIEFPALPPSEAPLLIIDGIYGAGFRGTPDADTAKAILWTNSQSALVISIDVPSGIDPTTGVAGGEAIYADYTLACHFPKLGCFLNQGWEHTGSVIVADLPLEQQRADLCLLEPSDIIHMLPRRHRMQNKYQAGSVAGIAGSLGMMGAASLAAEAAYTVGAGYVRMLLPETLSSEIVQLPREVVKTLLPKSIDSWIPWLSHADAVFAGPGLGRFPEIMERLSSLWPCLTMPTVVDADALFWLSTIPQEEWKIKNMVLTPHLGEVSRLLHRHISSVDGDLLHTLRAAASSTQSTIVVKGAPTFIFSGGQPVLVMPRGDPGMATAGTGDVLTGMICGLLAQKLTPSSAAVLATWLHGLAGEAAARARSSYGLMASSLIQFLPSVLLQLLEQGSEGLPRGYIPFGRAEPSTL